MFLKIDVLWLLIGDLLEVGMYGLFIIPTYMLIYILKDFSEKMGTNKPIMK